MKNKLLVLTAFMLLSFPKINFGKAPALGTASNFVLFSINIELSNAGISQACRK